MAYPSTKFIIEDDSDIESIPVPPDDNIDRPVYMAVFSSDKGPEEWQNSIMGQKFYNLYGTPNFFKHGQPSIQASAIINAGGRLYCKRVVADDAMLANTLIVAIVDKKLVQAVDGDGNPLFYNSAGKKTTDAGQMDATHYDDPAYPGLVMTQKCAIDIQARTVPLAGNSVDQFYLAAKKDTYKHTALGNHGEYPLFIITDNGRGVSHKKFRIFPDMNSSRPVDYVKYIIEVTENGEHLEQFAFTMNPDVIELGKNISIQNVIRMNSNQLKCRIFEDSINDFIANVAYIANLDPKTYGVSDILFGNDLFGRPWDTIMMNADGQQANVNLQNIYGIALVGGSNGAFGDTPIKSPMYMNELIKSFNGDFSDDIYDLDNVRIDAIFDANYPAPVKREIENFVEFRDDCFYFRDMGIGLETIEMIKTANINNLKSRLCATYENSWDIIEPYSKKQITVTCTYSLAKAFVPHFLNGRSRPFCGQLYSVTFPDVIPGTVNFTPKNTPKLDQKQLIDDMRINYCSYYNGVLTMETDYTSQERYTQLSWLHNVLSIQHLIKILRERCPKIRYNFLDSDSLKKYEADVQTVIDSFSNIFESIKMKYVEDNIYRNNKIFYAVIDVKMRDFVQSELFKITVLKNA